MNMEAHNTQKIPYAYRTFAEHYRDYAMKYKATIMKKAFEKTIN